jgi:TP901 family phage tail tape measure protein
MAEDIRILIRAATEGLNQVTDAAKRIKDLGGDASDTEAKARKLKDELDQLATQQRLITQFQQLKTETGSTRQALEQAQQRAQQLGREFAQTEAPTAKLKREFAAARGEVTQLRERLIAQNAALNETRGALTATGVNTKELASAQVQIRTRTAEAQQGLKGYATELDRTEQELRETKGQLAETEQQVDKTSGGFGRFKSALLGVGAALGVGGLGAVLRNSSVAAADFGLKVAEVSTLLEDTSGIERITDASRELAKEFGNSPTEQAQAFYNIISAGTTDAAEATELLTAANKLAVGGVTDVATAADGITSVLNAYGLSADNAAKVSDQLFTTVRLGKTTVDEYSSALGQVAPIAAQVGVGFDEVSAAVASLTANGVKTSQAITQIRAAISNVLKPTSEASQLAEDLGLNFSATGLKAQGLGEFLRGVIGATDGNVESLTRLFGSTEAVQAVLGLTGDELERFDTNLAQVRDSTGATEVAFEKVAGSDSSTAARMRAQFADIALTAGELINRALLPLGTELAKIAGEFAATGESGRKMGEEVEAASARIAPVLSAIAGSVQVFAGGVQVLFNTVQIAARGLLASITDMAAGISLALAKVTFGDVSARLQADGENLRATAQEIRDGISTDLEDIGRAGDSARDGLIRAGEGFAELGRGAEGATPQVAANAAAVGGLSEEAQAAADAQLDAARAAALSGSSAAEASPQVQALATSQRQLAVEAEKVGVKTVAASGQVREALKTLGIDAAAVLTGISTENGKLLESFRVLVNDSDSDPRLKIAAFDALFARLKTPQELEELKETFGKGFPGAVKESEVRLAALVQRLTELKTPAKEAANEVRTLNDLADAYNNRIQEQIKSAAAFNAAQQDRINKIKDEADAREQLLTKLREERDLQREIRDAEIRRDGLDARDIPDRNTGAAGGNAANRRGFGTLSAADQQLIAELEARRNADLIAGSNARTRGVSTAGPGEAFRTANQIARNNAELDQLVLSLNQGGGAAARARDALRTQLGIGPSGPDPATAAANQAARNVQTIRIELPRVGRFGGGAITTTDSSSAATLQSFIEQLLREQALSGAGA